jgi:hypothetical protein
MLDWGTCGWRVVSVSHTCTKRVAYMLHGAVCIAEALDSEVHELLPRGSASSRFISRAFAVT